MEPSVIAEFFAFVDTDHDGYITVEEIKAACAVDINGDGAITEEERLQCARVWINEKLPLQDLDADHRITLQELLTYSA